MIHSLCPVPVRHTADTQEILNGWKENRIELHLGRTWNIKPKNLDFVIGLQGVCV